MSILQIYEMHALCQFLDREVLGGGGWLRRTRMVKRRIRIKRRTRMVKRRIRIKRRVYLKEAKRGVDKIEDYSE
ncbi:hypothetical protein PP707_01470 [Acetobacter pasteurianus]|nr:hypothetical protein [Acetobacter pasteurianus]